MTIGMIYANTPEKIETIASASAGMWRCSAKDAGPLSRQRFKPHTTILHHRSLLYQARVSLI
jgi:hypothetical protein